MSKIESFIYKMKNKRGNSIVIVIGIFVILMVTMASFFQSGVKSNYTANLVGERLLAQKFASSVALVTCQYIKSILPQRNGENPLSMELHDILSVPFNMMKSESRVPSSGESLYEILNNKLKVESEGILDYLIKEYTETENNKLGLRGLKIKNLHIELRKSEFQPKPLTSNGEHFFPREKEGYLHICFDVHYTIPGKKASEPAKENYRFSSKVKVCSNLVPVLSKFNLYIGSALGINNEASNQRFNVIKTNCNGLLKEGELIRPWVLDNGPLNKSARDFNTFVNYQTGFVYLGGGTPSKPIILGLGLVGDVTYSKRYYGEGFHLYKNQTTGAGYWKIFKKLGENGFVMQADLGLWDNDDNAEDNKKFKHYRDRFSQACQKQTKRNSIFKLYGIDDSESPTVVLGHVNSMVGSIREFILFDSPISSGVYERDELEYIEDNREFELAIEDANEDDDNGSGDAGEGNYEIDHLYTCYKENVGAPLTLDKYNKEFATQLTMYNYNLGLLNYCTGNAVVSPLKQHFTEQKITELCTVPNGLSSNSNNGSVFNSIPGIYSKIYPDKSLEDINVFLEEKAIKERCSWFYELNENENITDFLKKYGYLTANGSLVLEGWGYIKNKGPNPVEIPAISSVDGQGGLVIEPMNEGNANIIIKDNIVERTGHLTLLALKGSISIAPNVHQVDASLIAGGGQLILEGSEPDLEIKGNVAMKEIDGKESGLSKIGRGLKLVYNPNLAALPFCNDNTDSSRSERDMLMYSLEDEPRLSD